jgi:glycosyltransferase involved in cell wall biosynthesis
MISLTPATDRPSITAVIVATNEEAMIVNCIESLRWCDEILVLDAGSEDKTISLAESAGARVVSFSHPSMARKRNEALKRVKTDWLIYVDADERVTPQLAKEILVQLETGTASALTLHRQNIHYGKAFHYGGWQEDTVTRAFAKEAFQEWYGDIHESPRFTGEAVTLSTPLLHLTHRNTLDGLRKTIAWTPIEARLLFEGGTPPVTVKTIFRKGIMEMVRRIFLKQGRKDGTEGWIEGIVQGINRMLVYIQVWELQRKPSLEQTYQHLEAQLLEKWRTTSQD